MYDNLLNAVLYGENGFGSYIESDDKEECLNIYVRYSNSKCHFVNVSISKY